MVFASRHTARPLERLGVLRADRALAEHVLRDRRHDIVVMPGGDLETWRPWKERYRVRWHGRTGYARTALRAGVPIVPIACAGAHSTLFVITDGRHFARRIGLPAVARSEIFPIHISLPFGLTIGPFPHIPPPAHFRYLVGEPIYPPVELAPDEEPGPDLLRHHDIEVRAAVQGLLDRLRGGECK